MLTERYAYKGPDEYDIEDYVFFLYNTLTQEHDRMTLLATDRNWEYAPIKVDEPIELSHDIKGVCTQHFFFKNEHYPIVLIDHIPIDDVRSAIKNYIRTNGYHWMSEPGLEYLKELKKRKLL